MKDISYNVGCRICKRTTLVSILQLGPQPPANAFLKKTQLKKREPFYPLDVYFCKSCHLVQLRDVVSPEILFKNYVYVSSTSPGFIKHFEQFAKKMIKEFKLTPRSFVVDIGSNDGILLKPYLKKNIKVLGIEPAKKIAEMAKSQGIETISEFFSCKLATQIRKKYGLAKLITATNVFAHINDIDEVTKGVLEMLDDEGVFIIEAPYLVDFLEKNLFDTVYHEHLSYYAVSPLQVFFRRFSMKIINVEKVPTHGGSIRVFVSKEKSLYVQSKQVHEFIAKEKKYQLHLFSTYKRFAKRIEKNKQVFQKLLHSLKSKQQVIVGYGAPAKGNTLLNYFGITKKYLEYIVDDSEWKQGLFTPGTHIPVVTPQKLNEAHPNYMLILAWNFAEPIMKKYAPLAKKGMKFILPVPHPIII